MNAGAGLGWLCYLAKITLELHLFLILCVNTKTYILSKLYTVEQASVQVLVFVSNKIKWQLWQRLFTQKNFCLEEATSELSFTALNYTEENSSITKYFMSN